MNIKLIISDLDGTLLNDAKEIHPDFWSVHEQLVDRGIQFAVATGRQLFTIEEQFEKIKDQIYFIAENGAIMKKKNHLLHIEPLEKDGVNQLIEVSRKIPNAYPIICGVNSAYIESTEEPFYSLAKQYYFQLKVVEDLTQVEDEILKVTVADYQGAETNSYSYFQKYQSQFKVVVSGALWVDITSANSSKGKTIGLLKERLNISHDETMVFGDFPNDLEMMAKGKHSYAMKNAHPDILAAANYVTDKDNNNAGVLDVIQRKVL